MTNAAFIQATTAAAKVPMTPPPPASYKTLPDLHQLAGQATELFGLDERQRNILNAAAQLGEKNNSCAFHGNHHFRMVSYEMMRNVQKHNEIYAGSGLELNNEDIMECLAMAMTHDYLHDGKGNAPGGDHVPFRLEQQSIKEALPDLKDAGMTEDNERSFRLGILATDVTPFGSENAPAKLVMRAYDRFINGNHDANNENIAEALAGTPFDGIERDPKLLIKAALMHTVDIAPSLAISRAVSDKTSRSLAEETGIEQIATPEGNLGFARDLGRHILVTAAGRALYEERYNDYVNELQKEAPPYTGLTP